MLNISQLGGLNILALSFESQFVQFWGTENKNYCYQY
jgi:hypothetical protein